MKPWDEKELLFPAHCQPKDLGHINTMHSFRQLPIKVVYKVCQHDLNGSQCKVHPRAYPPPRPERQKLEVVSSEVRTSYVSLAVYEPLWHELFWGIPHTRITPNCPGIDEHGCASRNHVAVHFTIL